MTLDFSNVGVVLAAGGSSRRFGIPKLWMPLAGKPVFAHALDLFLSVIPPSQIIPVIPKTEFQQYQDYLEKIYPHALIPIVIGGKDRRESVLNGLRALPENVDIVIIHDAARPLLTRLVLKEALHLCQTSRDGVILCSAAVDTVKRIDDSGFVQETYPRECLINVQTPQIFPLAHLRTAYAAVNDSPQIFTDDAAIYEAAGYPVRSFLHDEPNLKITHPYDLACAAAILTAEW